MLGKEEQIQVLLAQHPSWEEFLQAEYRSYVGQEGWIQELIGLHHIYLIQKAQGVPLPGHQPYQQLNLRVRREYQELHLHNLLQIQLNAMISDQRLYPLRFLQVRLH